MTQRRHLGTLDSQIPSILECGGGGGGDALGAWPCKSLTAKGGLRPLGAVPGRSPTAPPVRRTQTRTLWDRAEAKDGEKQSPRRRGVRGCPRAALATRAGPGPGLAAAAGGAVPPGSAFLPRRQPAGSVPPPLPLPRPGSGPGPGGAAAAMDTEEGAQPPPPRRRGEAPGGSSPAPASPPSLLQSDSDGAEERQQRRGRRQHRPEPEPGGAEEKAPPPPGEEESEEAGPRGRAASSEGGETSGRARIKERENSEKEHQWLVLEASLTPWEEWFVCKEKEQRARLQNRALEELSLQQEKRKEVEEREKRKKYAEEKHKEWLHKKNEQERKERERKLNKEMEEKAAKDLEKEHLQEKAKEKYKEWLRKKMAEEHERKKKEKEEEKQRLAEQQEKKEISEKKFKEWLQNVKNKPRLIPRSYGYANGKLTGYYSGIACPQPSFYNPIPWKPIYIPPPKESKTAVTVKKSKRPVSIPPYRSSSLVFHKNKGNLCLGTLCRMQR
ncbi:coiled-coil domain-containing protein 34 [Vombatus ursinus]|uniref:coiled-coil domain-containing protein 34 n=1 Tax=Vombatus ursinus TaxID=29139 RepID=UPI000FFD6EE4|nr:coiled-coil domain-containing protein 34 [Vombatus ursinus]